MALSQKERSQRYYEKHKEKLRAAARIRSAEWRKANPGKNDEVRDKWRATHHAEERAQQKEYRKLHKAEIKMHDRFKHIFRKYGMTREQYEAMLVSQDNKCAVCQSEFSDDNRVCVDHCHASGKVRGLLCNGCNCAAGFAKDDPERLERVVQYLRERTPRSS